MPRRGLIQTFLAITFTALMVQAGVAAEPGVARISDHSSKPKEVVRGQSPQPALFDETSGVKPIPRPVSHGQVVPPAPVVTPAPVVGYHPTYPGPVSQGHYPRLDAPLYPSPKPNVPYQVGGTYITNQAFAPHEMLYEHDYKALYPPYYYKVRGGWIITPRGVRQHEGWRLEGTEVRVQYRNKPPWYAKWHDPSIWW